MSSGRRILVVYYSRTGHTARVAKDIAARLNADVEEVRERRPRPGFVGYLRGCYDSLRKQVTEIEEPQRSPVDYSLIIVGTPVWVWDMTPAIRSYLQWARGRARAIAFFVTSGDTDVQKIAPALENAVNNKPIASTGLNERELKNPVEYEKKVTTFVANLQQSLTAKTLEA